MPFFRGECRLTTPTNDQVILTVTFEITNSGTDEELFTLARTLFENRYVLALDMIMMDGTEFHGWILRRIDGPVADN